MKLAVDAGPDGCFGLDPRPQMMVSDLANYITQKAGLQRTVKLEFEDRILRRRDTLIQAGLHDSAILRVVTRHRLKVCA